MMNYLDNLAAGILQLEPGGISKVRFAKLIYLVHKSLVQNKKSEVAQLSFIRMPLGPVPDGFLKLHTKSFITTEESSVGLSYDRMLYRLTPGVDVSNDIDLRHIKLLLDHLRTFTTNSLIEYTHGEPSWINNKNGVCYQISSEDLLRKIIKKSIGMINSEDSNLMQAQLVGGMLDDIVEQSTLLEYPEK
jgi:uncharacterized phage-associated protein